jgi:hypothetical protein
VDAPVAAGVPEITQVDALIVNPLGKVGETEQPVRADPLVENVAGVTVFDVPTVPALVAA